MDRSDYCYGRIDPFDNKTPYRVCYSRGVAPGCKFFLLFFIVKEIKQVENFYKRKFIALMMTKSCVFCVEELKDHVITELMGHFFIIKKIGNLLF